VTILGISFRQNTPFLAVEIILAMRRLWEQKARILSRMDEGRKRVI